MISRSKITVRYSETDQMGVVYHANYAAWFEIARSDLIKKIGITYIEMESMGLMVPIAELHIKYIEPAHYDNELIVETRITKLTRVKVEFEYAIYKRGRNTPINIGRSVHAFTDKNLKLIDMEKVYPEIYELLKSAVENN